MKTTWRLVFLINAHQYANQKPIGSVQSVHFYPNPFTIPSFQFFKGLVLQLSRAFVISLDFVCMHSDESFLSSIVCNVVMPFKSGTRASLVPRPIQKINRSGNESRVWVC